jgi:hypothetical protein
MKQTRGKAMPQKSSNQEILLEELRIIQSEMKQANISTARILTTLEAVEEQTKLTNGRVKKLEMWRVAFTAGLVAVGMLLAYEWQAFNTIVSKMAQ